jgi:hypothetical protein
VGPRAGLDDVEKRKFLPLTGLELRPLGSLACSQSLYQLSYPGSPNQLLYIFGKIIAVCSENQMKPIKHTLLVNCRILEH